MITEFELILMSNGEREVRERSEKWEERESVSERENEVLAECERRRGRD